MLALLQAEHDEEHRGGAQEHPDDVELVLVLLEVRQQDPRRDEADDADRHVDEEDPLPPEAVHEQAAGERPDEHRDARGRTPQAHGRAATGSPGTCG